MSSSRWARGLKPTSCISQDFDDAECNALAVAADKLGDSLQTAWDTGDALSDDEDEAMINATNERIARLEGQVKSLYAEVIKKVNMMEKVRGFGHI